MRKISIILIAMFMALTVAYKPDSARAAFTKFEIPAVPPQPVYLLKQYWNKYCSWAKCRLKTSKPGDGMLGVGQFAASSVAFTDMYNWDYEGIYKAFIKSYSEWSEYLASQAGTKIRAQSNTVEPDIMARQKIELAKRDVNTIDFCYPNPIGYMFTQTDRILERYIGLKEGEDRNLGRGISEDLPQVDMALGQYAAITDFTIDDSMDSGAYENFRYIAAVLAGRSKNPRPKDLNSKSVQGARYLTREASLSAYRSIMNQPWREYEATRLRVIPFRLLKEWMENLYKFVMEGNESEGTLEAPGSSDATLSGEPTVIVDRCKGWRDHCQGGEPGKPVQKFIDMTMAHPESYALLQKYCAKHNVPLDYMAALLGLETGGGNPAKKGLHGPFSNSGDNKYGVAGLGQQKGTTMEDVANYLHDPSFKVTCRALNPQCDPRLDDEKSIEASVVYFKMAMERNGNDVLRALFSYNQGPGGLQCVTGQMTKERCAKKGIETSPKCEGELYTNSLVCLPGSSIQNGVTLVYNGSTATLNGTPVPLTGELGDDDKTKPLTEEEYKALLKKLPGYDDLDMVSQEEAYNYLYQFFISEAYIRLLGATNSMGALKLRLPVRTMRYRLLDKIRQDIQLGEVLDMLADLPDYNDALAKVNQIVIK